jgi:hypothetical protein
MGVPYSTPLQADKVGHAVCQAVGDGATWSQVTNWGTKNGYTDTQAGQLAGAAVGAFCSQYTAAIQTQERQALVDVAGG